MTPINRKYLFASVMGLGYKLNINVLYPRLITLENRFAVLLMSWALHV